MIESRTTSTVTELPASCKSAMEHMEQELKKEEEGQSCEYRIADLPESCKKQIHEFERELNKQGYWNIALVAYQMNQR